MMLELNRPVESLAEYRKTLEKEPNRYWALAGARVAADCSRDPGTAARYAAMLDSLTTMRMKKPGPQDLASHQLAAEDPSIPAIQRRARGSQRFRLSSPVPLCRHRN